MANQEHLKFLKQGEDIWNRWREENPNTSIDLSYTDLRETNLSGINFGGANLKATNFDRANLYDTDFSYANLYYAQFKGANCCSTDFSYADLKNTRFYNADMQEADLSYADLTDAVLNDANLSQANLSGANLSNASFSTVIFDRANFENANLHGTNLHGSNLRDANFRNANLLGAYLDAAYLFDADLTGADLTNAVMGGTNFGDCDFRVMKGLETVRHYAPSPLSINSIYLSQGDIPEAFVRGTGAPNTFIEYIHSLVAHPIEHHTCFISYSSEDEAFCNRLYADLQNKGVRCWFAPYDMKVGDKIRDRIDASIRLHDKLLLILSKHSIASNWVEFEVETALEKEGQQKRKQTILVPIRLDSAVMSCSIPWARNLRQTRYIGNFERWKEHDEYQIAFERLLRDLKVVNSEKN